MEIDEELEAVKRLYFGTGVVVLRDPKHGITINFYSRELDEVFTIYHDFLERWSTTTTFYWNYGYYPTFGSFT
jgi:hypothetical protein